MVVELIEHGLADVPIVRLPADNNPVQILIFPVVVVPQKETFEVAAWPL